PGATEVCDPGDVDEDCDGFADNADPDGAQGQVTVFVDEDGDGYGRFGTGTALCDIPAGVTEKEGDCDDADATSYPGAPLLCDLADNDCDGLVTDDGLVTNTATGLTGTSIQGAIDAASPGANLSVCPGIYSERLTVDKGLVLDGLGGRTATFVQAGGLGRAVDVTADGVIMSNLTLLDGLAAEGAGLRVEGASSFTAISLAVEGGEATGAGGGVLLRDVASFTLSDLRVLDGAAALGGGVAFLESSGLALDLIARANAATEGGAVYVDGGAVVIENGLLELNDASGSGGGVRVLGSASLFDADLFDNDAPVGAAYHVSGGLVVLEDGSVRRNASTHSGALHVESNVEVTNVSWGVGLDDNTPVDVSVSGGASFSYGPFAAFSCVGDGSPTGGTPGCQ
ncbi:MAG: hypothetical protein KDA24_28555, partial [Deltaproteobacteria bacterium]|nr:hypothetical protein [Deltaproteobacteria bacterium]